MTESSKYVKTRLQDAAKLAKEILPLLQQDKSDIKEFSLYKMQVSFVDGTFLWDSRTGTAQWGTASEFIAYVLRRYW